MLGGNIINKNVSKDIFSICNRRGFFYPSAQVYGGISGFYDWGPLGTLLKNNLIEIWRKIFINDENNIYEIDGSHILPYIVLKASGHVDHFTDPQTKCIKCKKLFRVDHLIRDRVRLDVEGKSLDELTELLREYNVKCPICDGELSDAQIHHPMFSTVVGANLNAFLRPETAQSIFLDFKNVKRSTRTKLPFGIAQIGRSYRNETSARQGLIRLREFNQMEIEMFVCEDELNSHPKFSEIENKKIRILTTENQLGKSMNEKEITAKKAVEREILPNQYMAYYLVKETIFYQKIGIPYSMFRFREMLPEQRPFYSGGNFDLEIRLSYGWTEVVGNAYRKDYDLLTHSKFCGKKFSVLHKNRKIIPHVIEPSFGLERTIHSVLEHCFRRTKGERCWFDFPLIISPYKVNISPLDRRKSKQRDIALRIYEDFRKLGIKTTYDEIGRIGKIYARADEIGIPFSVTIDFNTIEDNCVTIRNRNTKKQKRINVDELPIIILKLIKKEMESDFPSSQINWEEI